MVDRSGPPKQQLVGRLQEMGCVSRDPAGGREHVQHGPGPAQFPSGGGDDVPIGVQAHPVNAPVDGAGVPAEGVEHVVGAQAPVVVDGIGPQLPVQVETLAVALRHVEGLAVGRDQDAVGHGGVEGNPGRGVGAVGLGVGPNHRAVVQLLHLAGVDVAGVPGIGEPDAPQPVHGQVVGSVQLLAVQPVGNGCGGAVGVEPDNGPAARAAAVEVAPSVVGQAVGVVGALPAGRDPAVGRVVLHDPAGGNVGEIDGLTVPHGALADAAVGPDDQLELPTHRKLLSVMDEMTTLVEGRGRL